MTPELIFRASRILTPDGVVAGSVAVAGGKIVEVAVGDLSAGDSPTVALAEDEVLRYLRGREIDLSQPSGQLLDHNHPS